MSCPSLRPVSPPPPLNTARRTCWPIVSNFYVTAAATYVTLTSWYMGADSLLENGITKKLLYIIRDKSLTSKHVPLRKVRKSRIILFIGVQLLGFGATFAITQTIGKLFLSRQLVSCSDFRNCVSRDWVPSGHHASSSSAHLHCSQVAIYQGGARNPRWPDSISLCELHFSNH